MRRSCLGLGLLVVVGLFGCGANEPAPGGASSTTTSAGPDVANSGNPATGSEKAVKVAWVTNGIADFWTIGEKGANDAARDVKCEVIVRMPAKGVTDQKRMIEELLVQQVDGVAISPIDPDNQGEILQEIANQTTLITHDSDAPKSGRKCYIGMSNYKAGQECGKLVKQALPDGGSVMVFVGRLGQLNARQRRQGMIDELLGREPDENRYDEPTGEIKGEKYVILDTYTDDFDRAKAKKVAENALTKYPDLGCMVGLFEYNPPILLQVLTEANKLNQVKIVGFDENDKTLQGIIDGTVVGTIVQDPYQYGYKSVDVLAKIARGEKDAYPESGFIDIPARAITKANVEEFWAKLKEQTGEK